MDDIYAAVGRRRLDLRLEPRSGSSRSGGEGTIAIQCLTAGAVPGGRWKDVPAGAIAPYQLPAHAACARRWWYGATAPAIVCVCRPQATARAMHARRCGDTGLRVYKPAVSGRRWIWRNHLVRKASHRLYRQAGVAPPQDVPGVAEVHDARRAIGEILQSGAAGPGAPPGQAVRRPGVAIQAWAGVPIQPLGAGEQGPPYRCDGAGAGVLDWSRSCVAKDAPGCREPHRALAENGGGLAGVEEAVATSRCWGAEQNTQDESLPEQHLRRHGREPREAELPDFKCSPSRAEERARTVRSRQLWDNPASAWRGHLGPGHCFTERVARLMASHVGSLRPWWPRGILGVAVVPIDARAPRATKLQFLLLTGGRCSPSSLPTTRFTRTRSLCDPPGRRALGAGLPRADEASSRSRLGGVGRLGGRRASRYQS